MQWEQQDMAEIYRFHVYRKSAKSRGRRIEIKGGHTLGDLDATIRDAFAYDWFDHLSEFYPGRAGRSESFGEIYPDSSGPGSKRRISSLGLQPGDKLEYIYDFGDYVQHVIELEAIVEPEKGVEYPHIVTKIKSRSKKPSDVED
jgi:hypothetical protein